MAHFAKLDADNIVINVTVVDNEVLVDDDGKENEQKGIQFLTDLFGYSKWRQTSYNAKFRKHYAGIGYKYDERLDAFIPPKPHDSWVFDEKTCSWIPPTPYPNDGKEYIWDEVTTSWKSFQEFYPS